jgi:hypothetical protein
VNKSYTTGHISSQVRNSQGEIEIKICSWIFRDGGNESLSFSLGKSRNSESPAATWGGNDIAATPQPAEHTGFEWLQCPFLAGTMVVERQAV